MILRKFKVIIKENMEDEHGNVVSTVGLRFDTGREFCGGFEKFDGPEITNDQIISAVCRLMERNLAIIPKEDDTTTSEKTVESCGIFKQTSAGKFSPV